MTRLDRVLAAIPLAVIVVWLALVQMFEVVGHKTPTLFTDELEWTQISRAIADDGHPARRGAPIFFKTLYVFLIAPVWWVHDTATAYGAAKYLNVAVMCLAAIPAYLLARRYVSKPAALAVATATIATPAMAYGGYLVPEVPAYPWSVLCAYLVVQSLAGRGRWWTVAAAGACVIAPLVRLQLIVLPVAFALAAFALWWAGPRARRLRAGWSAADHVGFWLLALGAFVVVNRAFLHRSYEWSYTTEFWRGRIFEHAVWAWGALTIGVGFLPTAAGLAALVPRREERERREDRALLAFLATALAAYLFYTGLKGAYLSTQFATRVVERNLIYAAPLLFLATALALERRRLRLLPVLAAAGVTIYLLAVVPVQLDFPYYEAFGFAMAAFANRIMHMPHATIDVWLIVLGVVAAALLLGLWLAHRYGRRETFAYRSALGVLAVVLVAWNLTGQIYESIGSNDYARATLDGFFDPPDWLDRATGGAGATYLGQQIIDPNGIHLLEFWNRSLKNVWSLDGTAPGPGPSLSPDFARVDGTLRPPPPTPYALTDNGVLLAGDPVLRVRDTNLRLYHVGTRWRLRAFQEGVSTDGWMALDSAYTRFVGSRRGTLVVTMSRKAFCPEHGPPPGHVTASYGQIRINANHQPELVPGRFRRTTVDVPNCQSRELRLRLGPPPWRVQLHMSVLFHPSEFGINDNRALGAQVTYVYRPD